MGLCIPDHCSKDDLWHVLDYGFTSSSLSNSIADNSTLLEVSKHGLNEKINELASGIFRGDHPVNEDARRRLSTASTIINRIKFPKQHQHGASHFTGSASVALIVCIFLMLFAVIGTLIEFKGLYMRIQAQKAKSSKNSSESDTSSGELTVNSDRSLGAIKGQQKTAKQIPKWAQFFLCFSLYGNATRLFTPKRTNERIRWTVSVLSGASQLDLWSWGTPV